MQERIWCIFNMFGLQFMGPLKSGSQILVGTFSHNVILATVTATLTSLIVAMLEIMLIIMFNGRKKILFSI
jgi:hypothetical protein